MGRLKNLIRNINYLTKHVLWVQREEDIVYLTKKILDDAAYEYELDYPGRKKLHILDTDQTMALIEQGNKSFIRTGDGEIAVMMGKDHELARYEKEIADRLIDALEQPRENLLVGINRNYFIPLGHDDHEYYRRYAYDFRKFYISHCSENITYIDAACTSCGNRKDKSLEQRHFDRWKNMFKDRDIVIVCGKGILDSLEFDVFELANSKKYIYGPKTNSWDVHEDIINSVIRDVSKDELLVFILGQGGKAMITELADLGYICWDVGHLAKYYNAFMTGMEWNKENTLKFFAPD